MTLQNSKKYIQDLFFTGLVLLLFFIFALGNSPISTPDGGRYIEIAREMLKTHQFLIPHLNGVIYLEKPPLFYWLQALSMSLFGFSDFALRSWNMLAAWFTCLVTFSAAYRLYDNKTARMAAFILASSILFFIMSHRITVDMTLTLFLTLTLFSFIQQHYYRAYFFSALAILTKGLIGLAFPCMIIGLWVLCTWQWRLVLKMRLLTGLLLVFVIAAPWHFYVQAHYPDFFKFYFLDQQFLRYSTMSAMRYQPAWFYLPVLLAGFFPWVVFLPNMLLSLLPSLSEKADNPVIKEKLFLCIWAVSIFIFFSFSHSKLVPYILPVFPPLALLKARYLTSILPAYKKFTLITKKQIHLSNSTSASSPSSSSEAPAEDPEKADRFSGLSAFADNDASKIFIKLPIVLLILFTIAIVVGLWQLQQHYIFSDAKLGPEFISLVIFTAISCLVVNLLCAWRWHLPGFIKSLFVSSIIMCLTISLNAPYLENRSVKALADKLKPELTQASQIIAYKHYYQDLPFYLQHDVIVVDWVNEFKFGLQEAPEPKRFLNQAQALKLWQSKQKVFIFTQDKDYQQLIRTYPDLTFRLLGHENDNVLLSNH